MLTSLQVFTAEFYDSRAAADVIRTYNNLPITGGTFLVSYLSEDPFIAEPSRNVKPNFPDYNTKSLLTKSASIPTCSPGRGSTSASTATSLAFSPGRLSAFPPGATPQVLSSLLNNSPATTTEGLSRRVEGLFQFQPFDTTSPSFRGTQSTTIPRRHSQLDMSAALWSTPAAEGLYNAPQEPYNATRPNRPPNLRRLTDSATLQTMLDGMNQTAQALQSQGPSSAPMSPNPITARSYSGWAQNDSRAVPVENMVFPERIAAGGFWVVYLNADNAGLDNRTTVMVKDVPVSHVPPPC